MHSIDSLAIDLDLQTPHAKAALAIALENVQLIDRKQLDYGPMNILATGEIGCAVRAQDKVSRLLHLINKESPLNESIEDSWRDLGNYALIAQVLRKGQWTPS